MRELPCRLTVPRCWMATALYTMIGMSRQYHARPPHAEDFQQTTINSIHINNAEPSQWGTKGGHAGGINIIKPWWYVEREHATHIQYVPRCKNVCSVRRTKDAHKSIKSGKLHVLSRVAWLKPTFISMSPKNYRYFNGSELLLMDCDDWNWIVWDYRHAYTLPWMELASMCWRKVILLLRDAHGGHSICGSVLEDSQQRQIGRGCYASLISVSIRRRHHGGHPCSRAFIFRITSSLAAVPISLLQ